MQTKDTLLHQILARANILRTLCLFLPSLPLRLARVNNKLCASLSDESVSIVLSEVFDDLGMFQANPFELARCGDAERIWLLLVHGVDANIVGHVR